VNGVLQSRDAAGSPVLWVSAFGTGVFRLSAEGAILYDRDRGLPSPFVTSLAETVNARGERILWIGTASGLARFEGGQITVVDQRRGLPAPEVYALFVSSQSPEGPVWVGTRGGGLVRLLDERFVAFDRASGLPGNQVYTVRETGPPEDPTLWAGTSNGLAAFSRGRWRTYDTSSGLPGNQISSVVETIAKNSTRTVWVGTTIAELAVRRYALHHAEPANGFFTNRVAAPRDERRGRRRGAVVSSDGDGIGRLAKGRWTVLDRAQGLPERTVNNMFETRGRVARSGRNAPAP
jgi:ligand-binding sensor domain-containing protein